MKIYISTHCIISLIHVGRIFDGRGFESWRCWTMRLVFNWKIDIPHETNMRRSLHQSTESNSQILTETSSPTNIVGKRSSKLESFTLTMKWLQFFIFCRQHEKSSHPDSGGKKMWFTSLHIHLQHIVEYDLLESVKGTLGLVTSFTKRIFQSVFPVSMTLIFNRRLGEHQILIADNEMKFRIFDRNTFEILATFLGPIYDTHVRQLVSFGWVYFHSILDIHVLM